MASFPGSRGHWEEGGLVPRLSWTLGGGWPRSQALVDTGRRVASFPGSRGHWEEGVASFSNSHGRSIFAAGTFLM